MKKFLKFVKENRFWAVVLAIVILTLSVLAIIDSDEERNLAAYEGQTSFSTIDLGYKGIYTALETAGKQNGTYSLERNSRSARFLPGNAIYLCPDAMKLLGSADPADLMKKVYGGGILILAIAGPEGILERYTDYAAEEKTDVSSQAESDTEEPKDGSSYDDSLYDRFSYRFLKQKPWDEGIENLAAEAEEALGRAENLSDYYRMRLEELIKSYRETPWTFCISSEEEIYWLLYFANGGQTPYSAIDGLPGYEEISRMKSEYCGLELVDCDYGEGRIIISECFFDLSNASLLLDNTAAAEFMVLVNEIAEVCETDRVIFDEKYCYLTETEEWDILGAGFIMGLAEICAAVVAYLLYKAQRFGVPEKLASVERRSETEGVEALANLYRGTGAASIGFLVRMEGLLSDLVKLYALPTSMNYTEIAAEISSSDTVNDNELKNLCRTYLSVLDGDISASKAGKLIEAIDSVRNRLFN